MATKSLTKREQLELLREQMELLEQEAQDEEDQMLLDSGKALKEEHKGAIERLNNINLSMQLLAQEIVSMKDIFKKMPMCEICLERYSDYTEAEDYCPICWHCALYNGDMGIEDIADVRFR